MIRMIESRSAGHAKAYFTDALSKSDYYVSSQELAGIWEGKLASRIGLRGSTSKEDFFALCENVNPATGKHLTPRTKDERRVGYDINFHCPKSVSILHALSGDDHILTAFRDSVTETMKAIEADAKTRIRQGGALADRETGELAWAQFVHQTARPVEGFAPDPHLHSHCFVFNATWDETEKRYKAGQFGDIKRDMPYYQARFYKVLTDKLMALGYQVRKSGKSFEVEGVPKQAIALFSKRTDEIGRIAKQKGITNEDELGTLGARTRAKKQKGASMDELKKEWLTQIKALGISQNEAAKPVRHHAPVKGNEALSAAQCVDYALLHSFERSSVMGDRRLLEAAYKQAMGCTGVSVGAIEAAFKADNRIIHVEEYGRTLCTTKEVLKEEKHMVELARKGQGKLSPLYDEAPPLNLTGQQAEAVAHVLTTNNRVSIIRGAAGSGKTTLMKEAVIKINEAGKQVVVVAPTAQASRGVLREEGFEQAETVAKLLTDEKIQQSLNGQVLWVDEAGLLGTKDMTALLELAAKQNASLILGGDTRQHAAVVRGDALRILNTVAGIKSAEVNKIYRQKSEDYKAAVMDLSKGHVKEAFEKLDAMDFIHTVDPLKPNEEIVNDYVAAVKKGKSALVVSPTHAQGEEVTAAIRAKLKEEGLIGKKEAAFFCLKNLNMTEAEKSDPRNFHEGYVVQFEQNAHNFTRGSRWMVEKADGKIVTLKNADGERQTLPTEHSERYAVYAQQEIVLAKGDKIRMTHNGFDADKKRLDNGALLDVVKVDASGITLRNKISHESYTLAKDYGHIAHAHCITSHASQGKTVDEVFIYQPAATFPATDAKQFYVSVSRGKERARIYTDDKAELMHYASELGERLSAIEMVGQSKLQKDFIERTPRNDKAKTKEKEKQPNIKPTKKKNHEFER